MSSKEWWVQGSSYIIYIVQTVRQWSWQKWQWIAGLVKIFEKTFYESPAYYHCVALKKSTLKMLAENSYKQFFHHGLTIQESIANFWHFISRFFFFDNNFKKNIKYQFIFLYVFFSQKFSYTQKWRFVKSTFFFRVRKKS